MQLSDRMKKYEKLYKHQLMFRMPVIIRIDGKAFHSYTRPLKAAYNEELAFLMKETTKYLVKNIQGCKVGYTQSDEISLLLTDWETYTTEQFFNGCQNKIESITASMTTGIFNFLKTSNDILKEVRFDFAMFDARTFNLPKEEVTNYFIWRQEDAIRNGIQSLGQQYFTHNQLQNKSCKNIIDMLVKEYKINYHNCSDEQKNGVFFIKEFDKFSSPVIKDARHWIERYVENE